MFGIDECTGPAKFLCLGNGVQGQGRFTGTFRAIDFDDTATRKTTNTKSDIKTE